MPQQYTDTLQDIVGRLRSVRPGLPPSVARDFVNDTIRTCIDRRPTWSGLYKETTITIPDPYSNGSIDLTQGSKVITGTDTVWPVRDAVDTIISDGVTNTGMQTVVPATMDGITCESILYIDADGAPEAVNVIATNEVSFMAVFNKFHNPGCTVTMSSYVGRQLRLSYARPVYNIIAVHSTTELEIDMAWGMTTQLNQPYSIKKMYYTIAPDIKELIAVMDPLQGINLQIHVPMRLLAMRDPQRSGIGSPMMVAEYMPDSNGNMQYEIWPSPQAERTLRAFYTIQWKKLTAPGDRLPYFLNPTLLFYGAASHVFMLKFGDTDTNFNPQAAQMYRAEFEREFHSAVIADNAKAQQDYTFNYDALMIGGANFRQSHTDVDF
jgi:hypothetical protein